TPLFRSDARSLSWTVLECCSSRLPAGMHSADWRPVPRSGGLLGGGGRTPGHHGFRVLSDRPARAASPRADCPTLLVAHLPGASDHALPGPALLRHLP